MERKIGYSSNTKTIFRDFLGFWDFAQKKSQSRGFGIFRDFGFGIFRGKKNPKSPGFGIWELGSQKNPIPKPPLLWHLKSLGKKSKNFWKKLRIHKLCIIMNAICLIFSLTNSMGMNLREFKDFVLPVVAAGRTRWVTGGKPISTPGCAPTSTTILLYLLAVKTDKRNFRLKIPRFERSKRSW